MSAYFSAGLFALACTLFNRPYSISIFATADCGSVAAQPMYVSINPTSQSLVVAIQATPSCTGYLTFLGVSFGFTPSPLSGSITLANLSLPVKNTSYSIYIVDQIIEPSSAYKA